MNKLRIFVLLFAAINCNSICAQDRSRGPDSPHGSVVVVEPSTLDDAVVRFNTLAVENVIGAQQSALDSEEIIGAIRRWPNNLEIDDALKNKFDNIVKTGQMPNGSEIQFHTILLSGDYHFTVWWIDLKIDGYRFRIRDRTISSRPLTNDENMALVELNDLTKRLGEGHPKLKDLRRKLKLDQNGQ